MNKRPEDAIPQTRPDTPLDGTAKLPKVSVITVFHQRRQLAREFLRCWDVARGTLGLPVELLFADNASTDGTRELLVRRSSSATQLELFDQNHGFAAACNALARHATGEILVFLNYDIAFSGDWLEALIKPFRGRPHLGVVGNVQVAVRTQTVDHAGVFFSAEGSPSHFRPELGSLARLDLLPVPAVTGACLAVRREVFAAAGGFHEGYANSYEDIEFCVRVRELGHEIAVATRSRIWHHIGASPGRQARESVNAARFMERCGTAARRLSRFIPPDLGGTHAASGESVPRHASDVVQVYYDHGGGFSEADSVVHTFQRGRWNRLEIALALGAEPPAKLIRIDPGRSPGRIDIGGLALKFGPRRTSLGFLRGRDLRDKFEIHGTARVLDTGRGLSLESTGEDPQLLLHPDAVFPHIPNGAVLELWMIAREPVDSDNAAERFPVNQTPADARGVRPRVLVDLLRLSPGGVNGGIKVLVPELLRTVGARHRNALSIRVLVQPEVARELARPGDALEYVGSENGATATARQEAASADVLYAPLGYSTLSRAGLPQLTLLVDFLHRDIAGGLPEPEIAMREKYIVEALACSQAVQCMSHFVVDRLHAHYGHPRVRVVVIYAGAGHSGSSESAPANPATPPYFLYPANDWPHKNHETLLEAYALYHARRSDAWTLKLSGHFATPKRLEAVIERLGLQGSVAVLGHVQDAEFRKLFAGASGLVFPSRYEGFGIPVLEAFRLGVPVICSGLASLPEVGGVAYGYFDPEAPASIAEAMDRLTSDSAWRQQLAAAGRARARAFDPAREADKLARTFLELAKLPRSPD